MAFITLQGRDGDIDAVVFSSVFSKIKQRFQEGRLSVAELEKTDRGYTLKNYMNL
jgi:DNA polymerase III alpha subunit